MIWFISETAPTEGTLRVFPDVQLSNAYIILRPFFSPTVPEDSPEVLDPKNWKFGEFVFLFFRNDALISETDISTADFPGILPLGSGYTGPRPTLKRHPHLKLADAMVSVPKVNPGDMVFWHCVNRPSDAS